MTIGHTLHIRGCGFVPGRHRDSVVFRRAGGRYVFVEAGLASTRHLWAKVPAKLTRFLARHGGKGVATRFHLRVVARRYGASFTSKRLSPVVVPASAKP